MREIKFRLWDTERKEMVYPKLVGDTFQFGGMYLEELFNDPDVPVMQYTGLKDKNGREIYEGDIVTTDYPTVRNMADNWLVEYGHTGMFQLARGSFKESIHDLVYNKWKLEAIGNVYENPELLK
jgi:uncharacterized phage protein (TIGR01671 family)